MNLKDFKNKKSFLLGFLVVSSAILVAIDRIIKSYIVNNFKSGEEKILIRNILRLVFVKNDGAVFGLANGGYLVFMIFEIVLITGFVVRIMRSKIKFGATYVCFTLIIAGGIGNLIDRMTRHFVVDYIDVLFVKFYVFNFADAIITTSLFVWAIYVLFFESRFNKRETDESKNQ